MSQRTAYTPLTLRMPFLPGRIYGGRPILDIHRRQSDRVARVDIEMDSSAVVPRGIVATRHASKVGLQRSALANNSEFFTSASAPMPTTSEPDRSIPPGPRTTSNQSPNSTPKNEIHVHTNQNVKFIKKENIITLIPCGRHFFSYVHMVDSCIKRDALATGTCWTPGRKSRPTIAAAESGTLPGNTTNLSVSTQVDVAQA